MLTTPEDVDLILDKELILNSTMLVTLALISFRISFSATMAFVRICSAL